MDKVGKAEGINPFNSFAKVLLGTAISEQNIGFAVGLNFLGPLARTAFPNIKTFGFGEKFQAVTYGLEKLGIPAVEKIQQDTKGIGGYVNNSLRNFAHMA